MPHAAFGRTLILLAGLAFAAAAPAQKMYKWVDEKGVTHFSEHPPADGKKATEIEPKVTPPSGPVTAPVKGKESWREQENDFKKRQIERGQREQAEGRERAQRQERCDDARQRLAWYADGRIYRDNPDGTRVWMTDSNREATLAKYRALIKENCD